MCGSVGSTWKGGRVLRGAPPLHMPRGGTRPDSLGPLLCAQQQWGPQRGPGAGRGRLGRGCFPRNAWGRSRKQAHQGCWKRKPRWFLIGTECLPEQIKCLENNDAIQRGRRREEAKALPTSPPLTTEILPGVWTALAWNLLGEEGSERDGPEAAPPPTHLAVLSPSNAL